MFPLLSIHVAVYILLATLLLLGLALYNPRLMLQDYPPAIKSVVPPKTAEETRLSALIGLPFLIVLLFFPVYAAFVYLTGSEGGAGFFELWFYAFLVLFAFNIWDLLFIDWLVFCTLTPSRFVIPGSEGHPAYKDYGFHFRGFLIGTLFSLFLGLVAAGIVWLISLVIWR